MRRLLVNGEFLDPVAGASFFEADFERQVWGQRRALFSGWHVAEFKSPVFARGTDGGPKKPDLALIHEGFREWWVVEVEMASHDLQNHVLPQIDVFSLGQYTPDHAAYLSSRCPELDETRLRTLVTSVQPGVLVVVNEDAEGWPASLSSRGARYCVVQPHRDRHGHYGYFVSGFLPVAASSYLTSCRRAGWSPRAVHLQNPAAVALEHGDRVDIRGPSGTGSWKFMSTGDAGYLMPAGPGDALPQAAREFELHREDDGQLVFQVGHNILRRGT